MAASRRGTAAAADPLRDARVTLAPLLELLGELRDAMSTQRRVARARVVAARLLAAVETTLPADSFVLAYALQSVVTARMLPAVGEEDSFRARLALWRAEPALTLDPSRRCAALLVTRAAARTLFVLSPHEAVWMEQTGALTVDTLLAMSALQALTYWPSLLLAEQHATTRTALRAAVESFPHGYSAACLASQTGYRPELSGCYPVGVLVQWCRFPDIAPLASTVCDEACLSGLRDKFVGTSFERLPPPERMPMHLRFLLTDAAQVAEPGRMASNAVTAAATNDAAAAVAAAELAAARERMAPLVECVLKHNAASSKGRVTTERAAAAALVELADASVPSDSLVLAHALQGLSSSLWKPLVMPTSFEDIRASLTVWRDDDPQLQPSRRCAAILAARCDANTLLVLRPDEEVWMCSDKIGLRSPFYALVSCALDAAMYWPPVLREPGAQGATFLAAAVRALVHANSHDFTMRLTREPTVTIRLGESTTSLCGKLFDILQLHDLLPLVRDAVSDEAALHALGASLTARFRSEPLFANPEAQLESHVKRMAALAAAHGLQPCALPECGATEPHPQAYKRCSRCNAAKYCCREHQMADWKRHKRDGCTSESPKGDGCEE